MSYKPIDYALAFCQGVGSLRSKTLGLIALVCPQCGAQLDVSSGLESYFCSYYGTKILARSSADNSPTEESLMMRTFEFIAEGKRLRALEYIDRVFDINPLSQNAYLALLVLEAEALGRAQLAESKVPLERFKAYRKCAEFARGDLALFLEEANAATKRRYYENHVSVGHYPNKPNQKLDWVVLSKESNRTLLLSEVVFKRKGFHDGQTSVVWSQSSIRRWLNDSFLAECFTRAEVSRISTTNCADDRNARYGNTGGSSVNDKVFLLSAAETDRYFASNSERVGADENGSPLFWWLRTPGCKMDTAVGISSKGEICLGGCMWLETNSAFALRFGCKAKDATDTGV